MLKVMVGLFIAFSTATHADVFIQRDPHPAAQMVATTVTKALQIAAISNNSTKGKKMCQLVKSKMGTKHIGNKWLGRFAQLNRERRAVNEFIKLVPSIMVTRFLDFADGPVSGKVDVDAGVKTVSRNVVAVSTHVKTDKGQTYNIDVLVSTAGSYKIIDAKYMGISAVDYMGREYQRVLNNEYNKDTSSSMPVTELVEQVKAEHGFFRCP